MGPSLRTFELESFCRSRGVSAADEMVLRAVFDERDRLSKAIEDVIAEAVLSARIHQSDALPRSVQDAQVLVAEIAP